MKLILAFLLFTGLAFAQHSVTSTWMWAQGTGDPATGFNIKRGTATGGPYTTVGSVTCPANPCQAATAVYTFTDTASPTNALTPGNTYFYVATATGPGGESAPSNETSVKIPATPPAAPTSLSSTAK